MPSKYATEQRFQYSAVAIHIFGVLNISHVFSNFKRFRYGEVSVVEIHNFRGFRYFRGLVVFGFSALAYLPLGHAPLSSAEKMFTFDMLNLEKKLGYAHSSPLPLAGHFCHVPPQRISKYAPVFQQGFLAGGGGAWTTTG